MAYRREWLPLKSWRLDFFRWGVALSAKRAMPSNTRYWHAARLG